MAKATGKSQPGISRTWRAFGLKSRLRKTFKLLPDPLFLRIGAANVYAALGMALGRASPI